MHFLHDGLGVTEKFNTRICDRELARGALDEPRVEARFQLLNVATDP